MRPPADIKFLGFAIFGIFGGLTIRRAQNYTVFPDFVSFLQSQSQNSAIVGDEGT